MSYVNEQSRQRKFSSKGYQHIFQISSDYGIIFCNVADCVLLFTLLSSRAEKYHCRIISVTIMLNHFHIAAKFRSLGDMEKFMNEVTNVFARKFNKQYNRKGQVFHRPYGSTPKIKRQKINDNLIYIGNNGKDKMAVSNSREYKWNFLRYKNDIHPFSEMYDPSEASKQLLPLVIKVKDRHRSGKDIDYRLFNSEQYRSLSDKERAQLVDIIITTYNVIDYDEILNQHETMDNFYRALSLVSGSEHSLKDDNDQEDYRHYYKMIKIAKEEGYDVSVERLYGIGDGQGQLSPDIAKVLIRRFQSEVGASWTEIKKFLHIPLE